MPRGEYKTLTLVQKIEVIKEVEKGLKKKNVIAKEFGIPPNTLSTYLKIKDAIFNSWGVHGGGERKRVRGPEYPDIDESVLKWFTQAHNKTIPLSGTLIRVKAEEFASKLGKSDFKASTRWLDGFKERNGISFKSV